MISVDEGLRLVLEQANALPPIRLDIAADSAAALGMILAEEIVSEYDSPPHDKAMVDGYAIQSADLTAGISEFNLLEEITAGQVPTLTVLTGQTSRIMTGAPLPNGADAVVMIEKSELLTPDRVRLIESAAKSGQNIQRRGTVMQSGDVVLKTGGELRACEIGLLSEIGSTKVQAFARPKVAVLATGNELVPATQSVGPGQIRNSNGPLLVAAITQAGAMPLDLGIGRDEPTELRTKIAQGLSAANILLLSGGVSAGVLDLIPSILTELGVREVFHKVRMKPGKPLWFGVWSQGPVPTSVPTLVFGLPGNPVSSWVCFELFVRPAIERLAGQSQVGLKMGRAKLSASFRHRGDRPTFHPGRIQAVTDESIGPSVSTGRDTGVWQVAPLAWRGSADLLTICQANVLIHFPSGDRDYSIGEELPVYFLP